MIIKPPITNLLKIILILDFICRLLTLEHECMNEAFFKTTLLMKCIVAALILGTHQTSKRSNNIRLKSTEIT
jgi:hypothetical protein